MADPQIWNWGNLDRNEAIRMLMGQNEGTFLVRSSATQQGAYSISVVQQGQVRHVRVANKDGGFAMNQADTACPDIADLINSQLHKKVKTTQIGSQAQETQLLKFPFPNPERQAAARAAIAKAGHGAAAPSSDRAAELARLQAQAGFGGGGAGDEEEEEEEDEEEAGAAAVDPNVKKGVKMQAIADYTAHKEGELSFKNGDKIFIVLKDPAQKMWQGVLAGEIGLVPAGMVEEYDVDARTEDLEKQKEAIAAAGVVVKITRCLVKDAYESKGPGELTLVAGSAVMLPTMDVLDSPHSPGVQMYKGVNAGAVGLMPCANLEVSDAKPTAAAPVAAPPPAAAAAASGGDEPSGNDGSVLEAMADTLFKLIPPDADGCLGGKALQPVMSKCDPAVPGAMLGKIWSACDTAKAGKLNKAQVVKMLGFIGQVQKGMTPNPAEYMTAPPPSITGLPVPAGGGGGGAAPAAAAAAPAPAAAAPAAAEGAMTLVATVEKLFGMIPPDADGCLSGKQLMPVMNKCDPAIEQGMLGKIWTVCDDAKSGKLTKQQVMKMFGLMSQAQTGGTPNPTELDGNTPAPKVTGLN
jgi:Ca2+-binding EF-hand superfamily protein